MKKIFKEIIWIVVLSGIFGIIYNLVSEKSIPFIAVKPDVKAVSDSVLYGGDKVKDEYFDKIVSYEQIIKLLNKKDVQFVDARSPEQFAEESIGNAVNLFPLTDKQDELLIKLNELPHEKILIVYCDGGDCDLSHELAKLLFEFGYKQTFLYQGGWEEWENRKSERRKNRKLER
ncbi:MAG: rhodanese-like domain-containing protein [bacterium]